MTKEQGVTNQEVELAISKLKEIGYEIGRAEMKKELKKIFFKLLDNVLEAELIDDHTYFILEKELKKELEGK